MTDDIFKDSAGIYIYPLKLDNRTFFGNTGQI